MADAKQQRQTELEELSKRLEAASNEDIAKIYFSIAGYDPFKRNRLVLPSAVRVKAIKKIKEAISLGAVIVGKPAS